MNNDRSNRQLSPESPSRVSPPKSQPPADLSFKKTKNINGSYFLITAEVSKDKFFTVQLENLESVTEKYCLKLSEQEARKFLKVYFHNSVEKMLDNLVVDPNDQSCYLKYEVSRAVTDTSHPDKLPRINENSQEISRIEDNRQGPSPSNTAPEAVSRPCLQQH